MTFSIQYSIKCVNKMYIYILIISYMSYNSIKYGFCPKMQFKKVDGCA